MSPTAKRWSFGNADLLGGGRALVGEALVRDERLRLAVLDDVGDLGPDEVRVDRDEVEPGLEHGEVELEDLHAVREHHCHRVARLEAQRRAGRARPGCSTRAARPLAPRARRGRRPRASPGLPGRCSRNRARPLQSTPYFFVFTLAGRELLGGAVVGLPDRGARDRVGQQEPARQLVTGELVACVGLELLE